MQDHHLSHYVILITGLVVFGVAFFFLRFNFVYQMVATSLVSIFYCAWGILHHHIEGRLNKLIVLEYISFSVFIFALVFLALNA